jgi:uncharacterized protein YqcC (DUF446 family)
MLTVSAIGSCRIFTPINLMKRRGRVAVRHEGAEWYTHSTYDALQKVDIMNGEKDVPPAIPPLIIHGVEKFHPDVIKPGFYDGTDVFVVEIASIKDYAVDDWHLQQWCVRDVLKNPEAFPESAEIAGRAELAVQSKDDLKAGMLAIVEKLGRPVIFVPHVNVIRDDGTPIPERARIHQAMTEVCADGAAKMFDPTPHVYEKGYEEAMSDSGHYRGPYELEMGHKILEFVHQEFGVPAS